jgi:hypothetical protein
MWGLDDDVLDWGRQVVKEVQRRREIGRFLAEEEGLRRLLSVMSG